MFDMPRINTAVDMIATFTSGLVFDTLLSESATIRTVALETANSSINEKSAIRYFIVSNSGLAYTSAVAARRSSSETTPEKR